MSAEATTKAQLFARVALEVAEKEPKKSAEQSGQKKLKGNAKEKKDTSAVLNRDQVEPLCGAAERSKEQFYLTTAINYTNGAPHMGHAYEAVTSDVISRYHRVYGRDVFFLTGSDEHGQKVEQSAIKDGVTPKQIADKYSSGFKALNKRLAISNDDYIRTTDEHHKEQARELWRMVRAKGDIYLKDYVGWYNVYEEQYITDKEAEANGFKDEHGRPYERKSEESYFFRMSKYQEQLIKYITEENPLFIQPESRKREMLSFLSEPLQDLCISRTVCQWGVTCPEDPEYKGEKNHVMYVWFDALTNYVSATHFLAKEDPKDRKRFWPATVHIIGKDIVRFHTIIWPTMLMSAGVPLPKTVFGHGFVVAADGVKMSKSLGNVLDPNDLLNIYPSDSLRFYIARTTSFGSDLPFSEQSLCGLHNSTLKDGLGNLLHRVTSLCQAYCDGKIPSDAPLKLNGTDYPFDLKNLKTIVEVCFSTRPAEVVLPSDFSNTAYPAVDVAAIRRGDGLQIQAAAEAVTEAINTLNRYLQTAEPWKIKGTDEASMAKKRGIIRAVMEGVYAVAHFLLPFTPDSMKTVFHKIGVKETTIPKLNDNFENLPPGTITYVGPILFDELAPGVGRVVQDFSKPSESKNSAKEAMEKAKAAKQARKEDAKKASQNAAKAAKEANATENNGPDFTKIEFRVGKIVKVWHHEKADRLFCEEIDIGEGEPRKIASGLREYYKLEDLQDRMVVVCCNLKPRKLEGFESNGMVICASAADKSKVELLDPPKGSKIGERLGMDGCDPNEHPAEPANRVSKKKIFELVAKDLKTNDACEATWQNHILVTSAGRCTVPSLKDSHLS